jgi:hypothetical protein
VLALAIVDTQITMGKKRARRCLVCGQTGKFGFGKRMCIPCRSLSMEQRRAKRAKRKPKGSVWTVGGGLPSLGKRH